MVTDGTSFVSAPYHDPTHPAPARRGVPRVVLTGTELPPRLRSGHRFRRDDAAAAAAVPDRNVGVDAGATYIVRTAEYVRDPDTGEYLRDARGERVVRRDGLSRAEWASQTGQAERLARARAWCTELAAPGGAWSRLQAVSRNVPEWGHFLAYSRAAHGFLAPGALDWLWAHEGALEAVFEEKLKPRWAHARFNSWSRNQSVLMSFWARIVRGRVEDGTAGRRPVLHYGDAAFNATGRGRPSAPTTAMHEACVAACGARWVRKADEHRSTKCCARCGEVLEYVHGGGGTVAPGGGHPRPSPPHPPPPPRKVTALTPDRVYAAAARRAATPLPNGWQRPPPRPLPEFRPVRGLLHCGSASCRAAGVTFVHRDVNAAVNILNNAVSLGAGTGMLTWMDREVQHNDPPRSGPGAPRFRLRVEDRQGGAHPAPGGGM